MELPLILVDDIEDELSDVFGDRHSRKLKDLTINQVKASTIYYCRTKRNGWHNTKVGRFNSYGSFSQSFEGAKAYAEKKRTNGTQFIIERKPCLIIYLSERKKISMTEINTLHPFSTLNFNLLEQDLNRMLHVPLSILVERFASDKLLHETFSRVMFFRQPINYEQKYELNTISFSSFISSSMGTKYYLQWGVSDSVNSEKGRDKLARLLNSSIARARRKRNKIKE